MKILSYRLAGTARPVEILYDPWGIPHIFAETEPDAFFGQGFAAARDRLWQIDLARRRALGRLAAVLGPSLVPYDQAARLFLYRGDEESEWLKYGPRIETDTAAFCAGLNAYVQLVRDGSVTTPLEFTKLGYLPEFCQPSDFIRIRMAGPFRANSKVRRARLAQLNALQFDEIVCHLEPPWKVVVPDGFDPFSVSVEDLQLYQLLSAPLPRTFQSDSDTSSSNSSSEGAFQLDLEDHEGSNAWVIGGALTKSVRPILANDPHLSISLPSVRYISHLNAPGLNVIGASWPGSPGVQNGHNAHIAFGRTNWSNDSEDVYILKTDPEHPDRYFYQDHWEPFSVLTEEISVRGAAPALATLKYSKLGPIVAEHPAEGRAIAIRTAFLEPGASSALTVLRYNFAHDWASFRQALRGIHYGTNYLYADVEGNIGWQAAGAVPIRQNHDGLMPVPGEQRYEWKGFWTLDELPGVLNPREGWIASANELNLPHDFPYAERKIGFEWPPGDRYERIAEVLKGGTAFVMEDSVALQHDVLAKRAPQLLSAICAVRTDDTRVKRSISILQSWNLKMEADSAGAAIFAVSRTMVHRAVRELVTPKELDELIPFVHPLVVRDVLENPDSRFLGGPPFDRDILIEGAVRRALDVIEERLGTDWSLWSWGRLNAAYLKHPLARIFTKDHWSTLNIDGGGSGGSTDTVMARYTIGKGSVINHGASYSMILDVGEWDNSLAMNSPGQSGDPASSHYRDLHSRWLSGQMFPLLFSRGEVERVAETQVWLQSAPANSDR